MNPARPKRARVRLAPGAYDELHRKVLHRDNWTCQTCGAKSNLEVHHKRFRSHSGDDSEWNLITLCYTCHAALHGH